MRHATWHSTFHIMLHCATPHLTTLRYIMPHTALATLRIATTLSTPIQTSPSHHNRYIVREIGEGTEVWLRPGLTNVPTLLHPESDFFGGFSQGPEASFLFATPDSLQRDARHVLK